MDNHKEKVQAANGEYADPALQVWLQKLREMHRPEEEAVILDM